MSWQSRRQEQESFEGAIRMLIAALILMGTAFACSTVYVDQLQTPSARAQKLEKMREAAAIQARWEASARARKDVKEVTE